MAAVSMSPIRGNEGVEKVYAAQLQPPLTPNVGTTTKYISPPRDVQKGWCSSITASCVPAPLRNVSAEFRPIKECLDAIKKAHQEHRTADEELLKQKLVNMRFTWAEPILIDLSVRVTDQLMKLLADDIQDNAETKFQLFMTQALLVVKTNKVYTLHDTKDQIGQGKLFYPAAHSSVIPSLKYQDGKQWLDLATGTTFGRIFNITVILPKETNDVDLSIDGKNGVKNRLRHFALEILNRIASSQTSIKKGFVEFLEKFVEVAQGAWTSYSKPKKVSKKKGESVANRAKRQNDHDGQIRHKLSTIQFYIRVANIYMERLKKSDELLKTMCIVKNYKALKLDECFEIARKEMQSLLFQEHAKTIAQRIIVPEAKPRVTRAASKVIASKVKVEQQQIKTAAEGITTFTKPAMKLKIPKLIFPSAASDEPMWLPQVSSKEKASKEEFAKTTVKTVKHPLKPLVPPKAIVKKGSLKIAPIPLNKVKNSSRLQAPPPTAAAAPIVKNSLSQNVVANAASVPKGKQPKAIQYQKFLEISDNIKELAAKYFSSKKLQDKKLIEKNAKEMIMKKFALSRSPNDLSLIVDKALRTLKGE